MAADFLGVLALGLRKGALPCGDAEIRAIPRELVEQGMIDGLRRLGALLRIVLPLSSPGLAAVAIFTFTGAWNELLLALVLITSESRRTLPVALNFAAQRFMTAGQTAGSVKG